MPAHPPPPSPLPPPAPGSEGRTARPALVAEDNDLNRQLISIWLAQYGLAPDTAGNGLEALEKACRTAYAVILMDVQMPGENGLWATRRVREMERAQGRNPCVIIGITSPGLGGEREACLAAGMDAYLPKPIAQGSLFQTLDRLLAGAGPPEASAPAPERPECRSAFDPAAVLERFRNDRLLLSRIRDLFLADLPGALETLRRALAAGDAPAAARAAHTLKGMAANFLAGEAVSAAGAVQTQAAAGALAAARREFESLENALGGLAEALKTL